MTQRTRYSRRGVPMNGLAIVDYNATRTRIAGGAGTANTIQL